MILWTLLMVAVLILALLGILYLIKRAQRFSCIKRLSNGKKLRLYLFSTPIVLVPIIFMSAFWGTINAEICILYLIVIWLILDGIFSILQKKKRQTFKHYYAGILAILITVIYLSAGWWSAHNVWQTNYTIHTDKKVGHLKIALISDSHTGTTFHGAGFAKWMKQIEKQKPDILVITGDFVDDDTTKEDMLSTCQTLGKMKTTYGIYYVFGNHDKGYNLPEYRGYSGDDLVAELKKNGVHVLEDDVVPIADGYDLIGRQDRSEEYKNGRASMNELVSGIDKKKFSIVLDHQPNDYENQAKANVDLVLSGHTHGGQLFPLMHIENLTGLGGDDKVYGYEKRNHTNFIVTSGISDWAIKFKTGCKSEYVMIDVLGK